MRLIPLLTLTLTLAAAPPYAVERTPAPRNFTAFSLRQAERELNARAPSPRVAELAGITDLIAFAIDRQSGDVILVGVVEEHRPALRLDSFVAAARAVIRRGQLPLVSIDPPVEADSEMQPVRFEGNIEDTTLGADLLQADIALKKLALGQLRAEVWGVKSYLALTAEHIRQQQQASPLNSRFWIRAGDGTPPSGGNQQGAFIVHRVQLLIDTQVLPGSEAGEDTPGTGFARSAAAAFPELSLQNQALAKVAPMLRMVTLVQGMSQTGAVDLLGFWLDRYRPAVVPTPRSVRLERVQTDVTGIGVLGMSGGIALNPKLQSLNAGDASVLREVVLASRPRPETLSWSLPLEGWDYSGGEDYLFSPSSAAPRQGFSIQRRMLDGPNSRLAPPRTTVPPVITPPRQPPPPPPAIVTPRLQTLSVPAAAAPSVPALVAGRFSTPSRTFEPLRPSSRIGGVMLSGTASVEGDGGAVDISSGNFALVVEGEKAKPSEAVYRKFVTALWSVYYYKQDPGISIDPIAEGVPKHLVRYIGNVIYSDLGRVMREADYLMKKLAVGTERTDYPGFKSVDERWAQQGDAITGASRRFWFVPENMRYRKAGNTLLFDSGAMTLRTEIDDARLRDLTSPGDLAFAKFFTANYEGLSRKYPVFEELMEYAKLVSLAKYLKESGVPLYWFLMANKDLVLGEDSPGVVAELVKESALRRGLVIRGGVNLGFEGQYRFDEAALESLRQARARLQISAPASNSAGGAEQEPAISRQDFSFRVDNSGYSVVPQHASTSGRDRLGIRYQTDLSIRKDGRPGLELARYFDPTRKGAGDFGDGWRLLLPYRVAPANQNTRRFLNAVIPVQMTLENLLTGSTELLTFSEARYAAAGYVPEKDSNSQIVGLFITAGGFFRLADRIGNEFWFDGGGNLSDMLLGDDVRVKVEYESGMTASFDSVPYELRPAGPQKVPFRNVILPKQLDVRDRIRGTVETLTFSDEGRIAGYLPTDKSKSRYEFLALLADGSFRLLDRQRNEAAFTAAGAFEGLIIAEDRRLVKALSMGSQTVKMRYTIDPVGNVMIAQAELTGSGGSAPIAAVRYSYAPDGTLVGVEHSAGPQSAPQQRAAR